MEEKAVDIETPSQEIDILRDIFTPNELAFMLFVSSIVVDMFAYKEKEKKTKNEMMYI